MILIVLTGQLNSNLTNNICLALQGLKQTLDVAWTLI